MPFYSVKMWPFMSNILFMKIYISCTFRPLKLKIVQHLGEERQKNTILSTIKNSLSKKLISLKQAFLWMIEVCKKNSTFLKENPFLAIFLNFKTIQKISKWLKNIFSVKKLEIFFGTPKPLAKTPTWG